MNDDNGPACGIRLSVIPGEPGRRLLEIIPGPTVPAALLAPLPPDFVIRLWGERFAVECGELDVDTLGDPPVLAYTVRGPLPDAPRGRPASYPHPTY